MRKLLGRTVVGLALVGPGCSFVGNIKRNVIHEPVLACDEYQIRKRNEALGGDAFAVMTGHYGCGFSQPYREGFVDGFGDYLTYGGCIDGCDEKPVVPPVPPAKYQRK